MAKRQRDYAAEYQRRQQRAVERGFSGYSSERSYRTEHSSSLSAAGTSALWQRTHRGDWRQADPHKLEAFYNEVVVPAGAFVKGERNGEIRRLAVVYFKRWEDYDTDEAVREMRMLYGETP